MFKKLYIIIIMGLAFFTLPVFSIENNNIIIKGNKFIDKEVILSIIESDIKLANPDLNILIKKLYKTGHFENIIITQEGNKVLIDLKEQLLINEILFQGNSRFKDKELFELINNFDKLKYYNEKKIDEFILNLKDLYLSFGYNQIVIDYDGDNVIIDNQSKIDLKLNIYEGKISKINKVYFSGNNFFDNNSLLSLINSKSQRSLLFFLKRNFKLFELQNDKNTLTKFYKDNGFKDANISFKTEYINKKNRFNIYFDIEENKKYFFNDFTINFESIVLSDDQQTKLLSIFNINKDKLLKKNISYNYSYFDIIEEIITDYLYNEGLLFFEVKVLEKISDQNVDVLFNVVKSNPTYVNQINIYGNSRTLDKVVRREMVVAEGDAINDFYIGKSIRNIKRLGIFKNVEVNQNQIDNESSDLDINVIEKPTGDFQIGLSVGSLDGATFVTG